MRMPGRQVRTARPVADRIRETVDVDPDTGCWLWSLRLDADGYGQIKVDGSTRCVTRVAYETFVGPVPDGQVVHPTCRTRHCVCPDHLETITYREQIARGDGDPARNFAAYYERRRNAETCPNGHPWDDENTRWTPLAGGGWQRVCRSCQRETMRDRRSDPDHVAAERARVRELYAENGEQVRARSNAWRRADYADRRAAGRCVTSGCDEPAVPGRAKCAPHAAKDSARVWGIKQATLTDIHAERGLDSCWLCGGAEFDDTDPMWHDHLIPRSLDGPDELWNLAPSHRSCNIRRQNTPLAETVARWHPDGLTGPIADVVAYALVRAAALPAEVSPAP